MPSPHPGDPRPPLRLPARPRVLVISLRRIGDLLLTTPLIRSIKAAHPDASVDVLVFGGSAGIVEGNPDIDKIIRMPSRPTFGQSLRMAFRLLRKYDLAISTQSGDRPTMLAAIAGRARIGIAQTEGSLPGRFVKRMALHRSIPDHGDVHRVELMLRLADEIGIARDPRMVCPADDPAAAIPSGDYAVIHAAPMFRYKQWTAQGWRDLAVALRGKRIQVVAICGPDPAERAYVDDVWQGMVDIRQPEWPTTVSLLKRARVYVGPDTSTSHLAAAAGCPSVVLFGPIDPRLWGPWPTGGLDYPWQASAAIQNRGNVWIMQNPLPCLPCTLEGCERHIGSVSICLEELSAAQVITAVEQALAFRGEDARRLSPEVLR